MTYYDGFIYGALAITSTAVITIGLSLLSKSIKTGLEAKYALDLISLGDDACNYRNIIQDAKIDGLAGLIMGGRRALRKAVRQNRAAR